MLTLEPRLIERLQIAAPAAQKVQSAGELAGIPEASQVAPALHVLYGGFQVLDNSSVAGVLIRETWLVVAVVKNAVQGRGAGVATADLKSKAAPLINQAAAALIGWRSGDTHTAHTPLTLVSGPKPKWSAGFGYFPLAFTTDLFVKGL